jgi:hypothetical protein
VQLVMLHLRRDKRRSSPKVVNDDTIVTRLNIEVHQSHRKTLFAIRQPDPQKVQILLMFSGLGGSFVVISCP